jgi:hypothetical protein
VARGGGERARERAARRAEPGAVGGRVDADGEHLYIAAL